MASPGRISAGTTRAASRVDRAGARFGRGAPRGEGFFALERPHEGALRVYQLVENTRSHRSIRAVYAELRHSKLLVLDALLAFGDVMASALE